VELHHSTVHSLIELISGLSEKGTRKGRGDYCIFCEAKESEIICHLQRAHYSEEEVITFMKLPQRSNERPLKTSEVRLKGDHAHNIQVILDKKGTLLVANTHIPGEEKDASQYLACPDCKSWVLTEDLVSHWCIYTKSDVASRVRRGMQMLEAELR
jgi:hypothetical protein